MSNNRHFFTAKKNKNDEFYTKLDDIEQELAHYSASFVNKIVYCNCDNPKYSNFWKYFHINFTKLGIKKLVATYYGDDSFVAEYLGVNDLDITEFNKYQLLGDGDFRSAECVNILRESDIVVTNPPFSLWRDLVHLVLKYNKKFLLIGNKTAVIYRELFYQMRDNKVWFGYTIPNEFITLSGLSKRVVGLCRWYTNIPPRKNLPLIKLVDENNHRKYSNYNAINVDNTKDIPDTNEIIGVPITFFDKYNPSQFEILGMSGDREFVETSCDFFISPSGNEKKLYKAQNKDWRDTHPYFADGDKLERLFYTRLFIRERNVNGKN